MLISIHLSVSAQDEDRTPSYEEGSWYVNDHPDDHVNVNLFFNSWKNSKTQIGHGGFVEQPFFTQGDPINPPRKGACLKYIHAYNHGILHSYQETSVTKHDDEQVVFYVMSGFGRVEAGGKSAEIKEGTGIFIPAGMEYNFVIAPADIYLNMASNPIPHEK